MTSSSPSVLAAFRAARSTSNSRSRVSSSFSNSSAGVHPPARAVEYRPQAEAALGEHQRLVEALGEAKEDQFLAQVSLRLAEHLLGHLAERLRIAAEHPGVEVVVDVAGGESVVEGRIGRQRRLGVLSRLLFALASIADGVVVRQDPLDRVAQERSWAGTRGCRAGNGPERSRPPSDPAPRPSASGPSPSHRFHRRP